MVYSLGLLTVIMHDITSVSPGLPSALTDVVDILFSSSVTEYFYTLHSATLDLLCMLFFVLLLLAKPFAWTGVSEGACAMYVHAY